MTTYNTGNPVPSADARDRYDNSQTFDEVINGTLTYYANRIGNNVLSLKGMADRFNADRGEREAVFSNFMIENEAEISAAAGAADRFVGVSAVAPTTRLNGDPLQQADEYQNSVDKLRYSWSGTSWVALNSSAQYLEQRLSSSEGAGIVVFDPSASYPSNSIGRSLQDLPEVVVDAADRAEAAADLALALSGIYADTTAGLLATTPGQVFGVPVTNDPTAIILYANVAGAAVDTGARLPSTSLLVTLGLDTSYSSRLDYVAAWLDSLNSMALGIRKDGRVIFGKGGDISARIDDINTALAGLPTSQDPVYDRSGYLWVWEDSAGNVAGGLDAAGNLISKGKNLNTMLLGGAGYERSGYVWGVMDSEGNIPLGLDTAGNLISKGVVISAGADIAQVIANTAAIAAIAKWITPSGFWWYGDSLSANGVGPHLATRLGKTVTVGAVGGQTAQQVAARFGGQVPLFTVASNTIPASGPVAVTARTIDPITNQGGGPITGKLAGIAGTFTSDGATFWTFTRTTAGTALVIDPETPFLIDITNDRMFGTVVFWYGRNSVGSPTFNADVKAAIADSIAQLKCSDKRFVVLSVLSWPSETTGTTNWTAVEQLNRDLKALYPRNYVDVLNLLRRSGDGSANDIADADSGIIPRSLRNSSADGHLNNNTGNPIVANRVHQFLTEKGWIA